MSKVYLDTCSIQRPLDTLSQIRLRLEAEAILGILAQVQTGRVVLISSTVLELEVAQNPLALRRGHGRQILRQAAAIVKVDASIEERAAEFKRRGIKSMDALHLACAEAAGVDYFCTCDDNLLRKAKRIALSRIRSVNPLELAEVLET
jgi:predicted nucleic acid-binding protein